MKYLALVLLWTLSLNSHAFMLAARCNYNNSMGECSVVNDSNFPARCQLQIQGRTSMGYTFNGFENVFLYPGQNAWAYVYANNPMIDPLVFVAGYATCNYVR